MKIIICFFWSRAGLLFAVFCLVMFLSLVSLADDWKKENKPKAVDRSNMDMTFNPCDDFWQYANGNWLKNNSIPAEYSMWSTWHETIEHTNTVLRMILEEAAANSLTPPEHSRTGGPTPTGNSSKHERLN